MFIFGAIIGALTGSGLALFLLSRWIKRSNDIGSMAGDLESFASLNVLHEVDGIDEDDYKQETALTDGVGQLNKRCRQAVRFYTEHPEYGRPVVLDEEKEK